MAPVSAFLHWSAIHLRLYLDDWLIQAASREQVLLALDTVLHLCHSLGIVVNWEKSQLVPTQRMVYLGVLLDSVSFRASPAQKRVEKLLSIGDVFLSCEEQPVSSWLELLGVLLSMSQLVPGGRLRRRSLQLVLRRAWDHCDQSVLVSWTPEIRLDLEWWLTRFRLEEGISLAQVSPQLDLWSDASDVGWGGSSGRGSHFRPLFARRSRVVHKRQGALGRGVRSSVLCPADFELHCGVVCRQLHSDFLPSQPRGHSTQLHRSTRSQMGGVASSSVDSTVHYGAQQCSSRFPFQTQSDLRVGMDSEDGGLSGS